MCDSSAYDIDRRRILQFVLTMSIGLLVCEMVLLIFL